MRFLMIALTLAASAAALRAGEPLDSPRPTPLTRPDMKQSLEDMKARTPRVPLPELTEEERAGLRGREAGYESRLRALYMPPRADGSRGGRGYFGSFGRDPDPNMSLDYAFKTRLFWIVSRTNNCQYCLGHQESKLLNTGMVEDEIAALDANWLAFAPGEQAAFAFARKITYEPHRIGDADIDALRPHFTDVQILEMILSIAGNNAINRWKEGVGVPQSEDGGIRIGRRTGDGASPADAGESHSYLTPTAPEHRDRITTVAAVLFEEESNAPTRTTVCRRPALEAREQVETALEACRERTPRLPLVDEAIAREVLGEDVPAGSLPQWVRLLANFPQDGSRRAVSFLRSDEQHPALSPLLKAQVSWIIARQDRAWYATAEAKERLEALGRSDEEIYRLDGDWQSFGATERALFTVARNLAASPVVLTDADVAEALDLTGPREVVQLISYTTGRAAYNRITEAAGLQAEQ